MEVQIIEGIEDEEVIVLPGIGNVVQGITGDVRITVQIVPHAQFTREGLNLHVTKQITLREALCGFHFDLTLLNKQNITIKNSKHPVKIVYPDMEQVCPGHGLKRDGKTGNMIIQFKVLFPETLTEEAQEKLKSIL
jgi:DnaJ family protein A protein 2